MNPNHKRQREKKNIAGKVHPCTMWLCVDRGKEKKSKKNEGEESLGGVG